VVFRRSTFSSALFLSILLSGCGDSVDVPGEPLPTDGGSDASADTAIDDTGTPDDTAIDPDTGIRDTGVAPDTTVIDTGAPDTGPDDTGVLDTGLPDTPDTALDCKTVSLAVDPASSLDPMKSGGLNVGHKTIVLPKLGAITSVNVRVTYPAGTDGVTPHPGKHAWVMFHHAVHGPYPGITYDRYDTIFDRWASHGFVVFSIDGSKVFFPPPPCPPGTIASGGGCFTYLSWAQQKEVAGMMDEAITYVLTQQEKSTFDFPCMVDPNRVAVSGHSRGGGAANLVTVARSDGAKIKGYVGFQPVNPEQTGMPSGTLVPIFDIPALWLDAANDGDVIYPITAELYAHTRGVASHVTILGGKHTYTLDTPYPDQGGTAATITPDEEKRVEIAYSVPFLRAYVRDATPAAADIDRATGPGGMGVDLTAISSGDATIRWRPADSYGSWVEKFDEATGVTPTTTVAGGTITLEGGMVASSYETYTGLLTGSGAVALAKLLHSTKLGWGTTDAAINIPIPSGALTGKKAIVFETSWLDSPSATSGTHPMYLELADSTGAKSQLAIKDLVGTGWSKRPRRLAAVYAPLTKFTGVDLTKATAIRIVAKAGTPTGQILIDLLRVE